MIICTGANGQLGRVVVATLSRRLPAIRLAAVVRDASKAAALADDGVDVRVADFADPAGLARAFAGAEQVLVVSVNQLGETARRLHESAFRAAAAAGARRVLYTSHMGARADSPFAPAVNHDFAERALAQLGVNVTSLRHGFYAESLLHMVGDGLKAGEIRAPADGPVSWTARADLAEADAAILVGDGKLDRITPPLTGAEAYTLADVAAIASEVAGRTVRRVVVSDEEWRDAKVANGVPAPMAELLLGSFRASRRGDFARTDPTLGNLLGRRPLTMRHALAAFLNPSAG